MFYDDILVTEAGSQQLPFVYKKEKRRKRKTIRIWVSIMKEVIVQYERSYWIMKLQSDLGYPATSGPAHIRISDLAGYERYAWTQQVQ